MRSIIRSSLNFISRSDGPCDVGVIGALFPKIRIWQFTGYSWAWLGHGRGHVRTLARARPRALEPVRLSA
jgi:hypothetical protein